MKNGTLLPVWLALIMALPTALKATDHPATTDELRKEIIDKLENRSLQCFDVSIAEVEVDFLINARNELVVLYVEGNSEKACEFVKRVLNYKRVKYRQDRQLTPYRVNIKLDNPCK